jgi:hypothetical protein
MKFIVHGGPPKTGSTAIQSFLARHRDELARQGVYIPKIGWASGAAHDALLEQLSGTHSHGFDLATLSREVRTSGCARVLISAEGTKLAIENGHGDELLSSLRHVGALTVDFIFYLRSPAAFVNSLYSELTGTLRNGKRWEDFAQGGRGCAYYDYEQTLQLAKQPGVQVIFRPLSPEVQVDVVKDFAEFIGVTDPDLPVERINASFGPITLECLRQTKAEYPTMTENERKALIGLLHDQLADLQESPFWAVDADTERRLAAACQQLNRLTQGLWGRDWEDIIGREQKPVNVFTPSKANEKDFALYQRKIATLRKIVDDFRHPPVAKAILRRLRTAALRLRQAKVT